MNMNRWSFGFGLVAAIAAGLLEAQAAFTPPQSASLELWVKADAITGLSDGASVSSWADLSGQAGSRNLVQATPAQQPKSSCTAAT